MRSAIQALGWSVLLYAVASCFAPQESSQFERRELSIPMRDGTRLFAVALVPKGRTDSLPIILIRTPFNAAREFSSAAVPAQLAELAVDGYIFVDQDIRGRFGSGGEFVTLRPQADPGDPKGVDESTDAWDTIDWLVKNLPNNNGKVGVIGISYRGWLAGLAGVNPHPALKAISPQAPVTDAWMGDDFFHQGAFRQTQAAAVAAYIESDKGFSITLPDQYDFYLGFPTLDSLARSIGVSDRPTWSGAVAHPAWDGYWQARAMQNVLTRPAVPTLFVGGFWDEEDILGPQLGYRTVEKADSNNWNRIVLGPWSHGGWARPGGDSLGPIQLGSPTADYFRASIQGPWLAWYLHGKGDGKFPEAWAFETGANAWRTFDRWPPGNGVARKLYLREGGKLSFEPPSATRPVRPDSVSRHTAEFDGFLSDPAHPVPYVPRPDDGEGWANWLEQDQRFVANRPDVVTWQSEPLTGEITIAGDVIASLFGSTSGGDADWVVKLIDVYPDTVPERPFMGGYQLMVNADIMRGRYWKSFTEATPIPSNKATPFTVDLHQQLYRFKRGHRLMVQVQSSWFPLYDRNPQIFLPNIFQARAGDFHSQEHRVYHSSQYPSHLNLLVLPPTN